MASRKPPLRAVGPGETAGPKKLLTILEATDEGTHRDALVAMRRRIAKAMDDVNCSTRDLAALSRRELEILREIEAIDAAAGEEGVVVHSDDEAWDSSAI